MKSLWQAFFSLSFFLSPIRPLMSEEIVSYRIMEQAGISKIYDPESKQWLEVLPKTSLLPKSLLLVESGGAILLEEVQHKRSQTALRQSYALRGPSLISLEPSELARWPKARTLPFLNQPDRIYPSFEAILEILAKRWQKAGVKFGQRSLIDYSPRSDDKGGELLFPSRNQTLVLDRIPMPLSVRWRVPAGTDRKQLSLQVSAVSQKKPYEVRSPLADEHTLWFSQAGIHYIRLRLGDSYSKKIRIKLIPPRFEDLAHRIVPSSPLKGQVLSENKLKELRWIRPELPQGTKVHIVVQNERGQILFHQAVGRDQSNFVLPKALGPGSYHWYLILSGKDDLTSSAYSSRPSYFSLLTKEQDPRTWKQIWTAHSQTTFTATDLDSQDSEE